MFTRTIEFRNAECKRMENGNVCVTFRDLIPLESIAAELDSIRLKWELSDSEIRELETVLDDVMLTRLFKSRLVREIIPN